MRGLTDKNNLFYHPGEDDKDRDSESPSRLSTGFDAADKDRERVHRDDVTAALLNATCSTPLAGGRPRTNSELHASFPELIKHRDVLLDRDITATPVDSNLLPNLSNNNNNSNLINNNTTNANNNKRRRKNSLNCDNTTSSITMQGTQERHYSQDSQVSQGTAKWWYIILKPFLFSILYRRRPTAAKSRVRCQN